MRSIEVCAGAGGQALGLEAAGFQHEALVEIDPWACKTLKLNRAGVERLGMRYRQLSCSPVQAY